ncbi:hypothetical protein GCM10009662_52560 [Catellatospora coxensis]|uniref:Uncharacterized protein n=1 Tax=Catellatospora coxensis TaxID=310354 RepID=A0A8J3LAM6_9ACTN|nr:hypothetical protein Cco03nite_82560 [Catellatospora coxensis]
MAPASGGLTNQTEHAQPRAAGGHLPNPTTYQSPLDLAARPARSSARASP